MSAPRGRDARRALPKSGGTGDGTHSRRAAAPHGDAAPRNSERAKNTGGSSDAPRTWMQWFLGLKGNNFFCKVDRAYMLDQFNLYGLRPLFSNYREVLDMILGPDISDTKDIEALDRNFQDAVDLFGLIHARFIITRRGQSRMARKFKRVSFGKCPRAFCARQALLPVGLQDTPRKSGVKVYCAACGQIFEPEPKLVANYIDGAYFGTTFPHLLLMEHPELCPNIANMSTEIYSPRIFGYRVYNEATSSLVVGGGGAALAAAAGSGATSAAATVASAPAVPPAAANVPKGAPPWSATTTAGAPRLRSGASSRSRGGGSRTKPSKER
jgi:casein kinase II subunit beta